MASPAANTPRVIPVACRPSGRPVPGRIVAAWLAGLAMLGVGARAAEAPSPSPAAGFTAMPAVAAGIDFTNAVPATRYLTNQIYLNGGGVALGDVDGDGRSDVFLAGAAGRSGLFRNLGGWQFTNVTAAAGLDLGKLDATGAVLADLDGSGSLDLVANTVGQGTRVWWNDGAGKFRPGPVLNPGRAGMSVAVADVDGDGDLDLYVTNYRGNTLRDDPGATFQVQDEGGRQRVIRYNGRPTSEPDLVGRFYVTPGGVKENGEPDALLLNDGRGGLAPVTWSDGTFRDEDDRPLTGPFYDWGLSVMIRDLTGDGRPDLYVCNDFESPDRFWVNATPPGGPLRFRLISTLALRNTSAFSMGVDAADLDRDGHVDFLVLDMLSRDHRLRNLQVAGLPPSYAVLGVYDDRPQFSHNTLFRGRGDGTFAEIGRLAGVSASEWSWTPVFLDVDLDGLEDLLISNGHEMDMMDIDVSDQADALKAGKRLSPREQLEMRRMFRRFNPPNVAFRNEGDFRFREVTTDWGFGVAEVANGMAAADLDGDGDLDLVANNLNAAPTLYRNNATAPRLGVRLRGPGANTRGLGARLRVEGGPRLQTQEMIAGGRYLSGDDALRVFAAGKASELSVEVTWPDGRKSVAAGVRPGSVVTVAYTNAVAAPPPPPVAGPGLFEDASARLGHRHAENPYDDWARQPLLPRNLSFPGPGVAWGDFDEDGWFDVAISAGQGGSLAAFRNDQRGGFQALTNAALSRPLPRDAAGVLIQRGFLFAASSNYEDGGTNGGALRLVDLGRGAGGEALLGQALPAGPLASADIDKDGSLEIFVGGGARGGAYPEAAPSLLVQTAGGRLSVRQRLEGLPPVGGAVFTDLDGDGWVDLVVTGDWSPPRFLRNELGKLVPWEPPVRGPGGKGGWEQFSGRWQGVAVGDFNEDGRQDLLVSNWGLNGFLVPAPGDPPWKCRWGDLDGNGTVEVLESRLAPDGREWPVRKYGSWVSAWPGLRDRFPNHGGFGDAPLATLVGADLARLPVRTAGWWATTLFLNLPGGFEARPLPREAQETPALAAVVADFDGDGHDDAFLGQNFFPVHPEEARQDAGRGLLLLGDGQGGLRPLPAAESGIEVPGEARGAAAADYDRDGRVDLLVGQNGAETRLWRNRGARPGFRLRLKGGASNPAAVGTRVRWVRDGRGVGPVHEFRAGSGYLGVDAPEWVSGRPAGATQLEVRWPDGAVTRPEVAPDASSLDLPAPAAGP